MELSQVTEQVVRRYFLDGRSKFNWRPATYRSYYMTLNVFFKWCRSGGHLQNNPVEGLELPPLGKTLPKRLLKKDALKLLEIVYNYPYVHSFIKYRNHAVFATFLFSGLRKSELLHLKCTDVDLENLTIFVRQGKGNKDRIIPMSYTLAQSLNRYLIERKKRKKTCPEFFTSSNRNQGFTNSGLKKWVTIFRKATNIYFTVHMLRHTFATLMLEGGCDIYSISRMLGHSDISTTTIYLSASAEHLRSQVTKHPLNRVQLQ